MRISAKSRYGLAAMISMSEYYNTGECVTLISLAEKLKISKIYLEQVFSMLKHAELVMSTKGPQGGYQLSKNPKDITVYDILSAIETSLFEKADASISNNAKEIEQVMQQSVFDPMDDCLYKTLSTISLEYLVAEVEKHSSNDNYMYYL